MACKHYLANNTRGITDKDDVKTIQNALNADGVTCVLSHKKYCAAFCTNLTFRNDRCISCLTDPHSCPEPSCFGTSPLSPTCKGCCAEVSEALICADCMSKKGDSPNAFKECMIQPGLSKTSIIIISVVVPTVVIIIVVSVLFSVRLRRRDNARKKLLRDVGVGGSIEFKKALKDIDYSKVNATVFKTLDKKIKVQQLKTQQNRKDKMVAQTGKIYNTDNDLEGL
jgi:hypothetical protein